MEVLIDTSTFIIEKGFIQQLSI